LAPQIQSGHPAGHPKLLQLETPLTRADRQTDVNIELLYQFYTDANKKYEYAL